MLQNIMESFLPMMTTEILEKAKKQNSEAAKRILIKGDAEVSAEAAKVFAESNILLLGNESQTVGPENAPMEVHLILLGAGTVLLEGIRLAEVSEGVLFLKRSTIKSIRCGRFALQSYTDRC